MLHTLATHLVDKDIANKSKNKIMFLAILFLCVPCKELHQRLQNLHTYQKQSHVVKLIATAMTSVTTLGTSNAAANRCEHIRHGQSHCIHDTHCVSLYCISIIALNQSQNVLNCVFKQEDFSTASSLHSCENLMHITRTQTSLLLCLLVNNFV